MSYCCGNVLYILIVYCIILVEIVGDDAISSESIRSLSANCHTYLFGIPSPTHSFIPGLKPSFSNPSHCSPSFLLLKYSLHGFPGLFTVISEHIWFLLLVFLFFKHFLVVGSVR